MFGQHEAFRDAAFQQLNARVKKTSHINDNDRMRVQAEPLPGDGFEQLFQCAAAAGQCNQSLRFFNHQTLALVHVVREVQLSQAVVPPLDFLHEMRQHADDIAAFRQGAVSKRAHQAGAAAAENDGDVVLCQRAAEAFGFFEIKRIALAAGGAVDTDAVDGQGDDSFCRFYTNSSSCLQSGEFASILRVTHLMRFAQNEALNPPAFSIAARASSTLIGSIKWPG